MHRGGRQVRVLARFLDGTNGRRRVSRPRRHRPLHSVDFPGEKHGAQIKHPRVASGYLLRGRKRIHRRIAGPASTHCGQPRTTTAIQHRPRKPVRSIGVAEFLRPNRGNFARGSRRAPEPHGNLADFFCSLGPIKNTTLCKQPVIKQTPQRVFEHRFPKRTSWAA
jgi:hypothetical protein